MDASLFETPGHLINRTARLGFRWSDQRFQKLGLAIAQMPVLYALKDGAAMTQKELARLARIEQPTMAQLLARMERDGLVRRTANPDDKRSALISLTAKAVKRLAPAREILREGNAVGLKGFSEREIASLAAMLKRVMKNLEADMGEG